MKTRLRSAAAGNTLLVTVITMAIVGVFVELALSYTNSVGRNVQRSLLFRQATNIGGQAEAPPRPRSRDPIMAISVIFILPRPMSSSRPSSPRIRPAQPTRPTSS